MDDPLQFELFTPEGQRDVQALWARLNTGSHRPVAVTLTRNRVTMCSVATGPDGRVRLRLHEAFLAAPEQVLTALHNYIRTGRRHYWGPVAAFARTIPADRVAGETASRVPPRASRVHDLKTIAQRVNRHYFNGGLAYRIEWGRERPPARCRTRRQSRSIRFGTWIPGLRIVRIHPLLDDARVPEAFVAYIVYHELLHAVVPPRVINGRRYDHPPEFRLLERGFDGYDRMRLLSRELLDLLL